MESLEQQLIRHEALRKLPYKCSSNRLTIGVGRNIQDNGITEEEAMFLLQNDIKRTEKELEQFSWWKKLDEVRKNCLINMVFNIGLPTFLKFKMLIADLEKGHFTSASANMLDSVWAKQVKGRAIELANQMKTGKYQV